MLKPLISMNLFPQVVATTDISELVAPFYEMGETLRQYAHAITAVFPTFVHPKVPRAWKGKRVYYNVMFGNYTDSEYVVANNMINALTGKSSWPYVADSGAAVWRLAFGIQPREIGLIGYDYGEPVETPIERSVMYPAYVEQYKAVGKDPRLIFNEFSVFKHPVFETESLTCGGWEYYKDTFLELLKSAYKSDNPAPNPPRTTNYSGGGCLFEAGFPGLSYGKLEEFLKG